ncbi:oxygen-dependent protoporphyrinogen oxidase KNAG_0L00980 [Huiozyma naganishii CBS 8797]|uniref:Protoporphyrinogen oxidase n=1 Tax=Huiozyma naganishii (strain ATCC MYA-139 / BCRC 22969 / CBS 8797 / KCTC 17520 / NBRC 10181 / NCYC 3082 / Yp74L-3) TaxID=1071383 RepID=J7RCW6_HUIN7|nr:hypothetical protein KNAG_0L00980 [Kazachstania naganishii CBS 8797]CCK72720.1 hypothetical protein KNAG_0L00980 [Kazachstania naganishii CBS 8797]
MLKQLTKLPLNSRVGVVGAGMSGLMFTYTLGKLRPDVNITLFERNKGKVGGWVNSWDTVDQNGDPIMFERGPRTLRGVSDGSVLMIDTLKELGKTNKLKCIEKTADANKKFIADPNDNLVQAPNSFLSFLKFSASPLGKGLFSAILLEWARKPCEDLFKDESAESLVRRRYGNDFIGNNILSAIFRGIYADDLSTLSAKKVLSKLYNDERLYGSTCKALLVKWKNRRLSGSNYDCPVPRLTDTILKYKDAFRKDENELYLLSRHLKKYPMLCFDGGLSTFPNAVKDAVDKMKNVTVIRDNVSNAHYKDGKLSVEVEGHKPQELDHLRFSVAPDSIEAVLGGSNKALSKKFKELEYLTIALVNYYLPNKDIIEKKYHSFGYLIPKSNKNPGKVLGVIFDSIIEKNAKPLFEPSQGGQSGNLARGKEYTKMTAMVGGYMFNDPKTRKPVVPPESATIANVRDAFKKHLHISEKDLDAGLWQYTLAENSLPRYSVGYCDWSAAAQSMVTKDYDGKVSLGGIGFAKSCGIPDVVTDGFIDALSLSQ